jgi:hypothetical protein
MPPTSQPFPTDSTTIVVNTVIDGVFKTAVAAAQAALVAADPAIFGLPVLKQVDDEVIHLIGNLIYQQFAQWVSFEILDFKDSSQLSDEQKALVALKQAQQGSDPHALQTALSQFDQAVEKLTHLDGAAHPGSL